MSYNYDPNNNHDNNDYNDYNDYNNQHDSYGRTSMPQHYLVTQSAKNIKAMARQTLKGHWGEAILAAFIIEAIMAGPRIIFSIIGGGFLAFISDFYNIVIVGPATVGLTMFFMAIFRMQDPEKRIIYKGFQDTGIFIKALMVYCGMMIRIIFLSFLFVIPGIIASFKYSMAFRVMIDHPEYSSGDCLRASANIMSGNKLKLFLLDLSFILWAIAVSVPQSIATQQAIANVQSFELLLTDIEIFSTVMNEVMSSPLVLVTELLSIILNVYIQLANCCFYDLAAGNLVVKQS